MRKDQRERDGSAYGESGPGAGSTEERWCTAGSSQNTFDSKHDRTEDPKSGGFIPHHIERHIEHARRMDRNACMYEVYTQE